MDDHEEDSDSKTEKTKTRKRKSGSEYAVQYWMYTFNVVRQPANGIATSSPILVSKNEALRLKVNSEDAQKLLHIFELILNYKREEFDLYTSLQPYIAYGLKTTKRKELTYSIHSCMVSKRYQAAAKLLELLALEREGKDHIFFYGTFKILNNISSNEVEIFIRSCLFLNKLNKKEVVLELMMYKMQKNDMEFPRELHQNITKRRNNLRKNYTLDNIYTAYASLYDYISWAKFIISPDVDNTQEGYKLKESFVSALSDVISQEGTWDIFVIKIREMLEYYDELDECEEILESHLYTNQENLHSHVYLYDFLKKYNRSEEKQKLALENIVKISPSDDLALDYVDLLISENNREKAIGVLLDFLEYFQNKENNLAWGELAKLSVTALKNSDVSLLKFLNKSWKKLRSYWPFYHYDIHTIDVSSQEKAKCITSKCEFLLMVAKNNKDDISYIEMVKILMASDQPKCYKTMTKKLNKIENLLTS